MRTLSLIRLLLVVGSLSTACSSHADSYKCQKPGGGYEYTDQPCATGKIRQGDSWVNMDEVRRKQREDEAQRQKEVAEREARKAEEVEKQEARKAEQRRQDEIVARHKATPYGESSSGNLSSQSAADIDKMTTYAVILGRGIACGASTQEPMKRVGKWFDNTFAPGSSAHKQYMVIFMTGIEHHAAQQRAGKSPDSCDSIRRTFSGFPWP